MLTTAHFYRRFDCARDIESDSLQSLAPILTATRRRNI